MDKFDGIVRIVYEVGCAGRNCCLVRENSTRSGLMKSLRDDWIKIDKKWFCPTCCGYVPISVSPEELRMIMGRRMKKINRFRTRRKETHKV